MARGGKREGAGRKLGAITKRTRAVAERALAEGKAPLEVMLDNMRHFQQVALDAEAVIDGMNEEQVLSLGQTHEERFRALLAKVKQAAGLRVMAHECARDAAPFMHAKLSSVQHSGDSENPIHHKIDSDAGFGELVGALDSAARAATGSDSGAGEVDTAGKTPTANT